MKRYPAAVLAALLFLSPLWADPPKLVIPAEVRPSGQYVRVVPETDAVSVLYIGLSGVDGFPSEELKDARRFLLDTRGLAAGRYKFAAVGAAKTGEQTRVDFAVVVGDAPPGPGPEPPGPGPQPPIPTEGLKVLLLYESAELSNLPAGQRGALYSTKVREYLRGKKAEWRVWDKDADPGGDDAIWKTLMARPRKELPWVIVTNGKQTYEGPVPASVDEFLTLLKKYGG